MLLLLTDSSSSSDEEDEDEESLRRHLLGLGERLLLLSLGLGDLLLLGLGDLLLLGLGDLLLLGLADLLLLGSRSPLELVVDLDLVNHLVGDLAPPPLLELDLERDDDANRRGIATLV